MLFWTPDHGVDWPALDRPKIRGFVPLHPLPVSQDASLVSRPCLRFRVLAERAGECRTKTLSCLSLLSPATAMRILSPQRTPTLLCPAAKVRGLLSSPRGRALECQRGCDLSHSVQSSCSQMRKLRLRGGGFAQGRRWAPKLQGLAPAWRPGSPVEAGM